ncbi:MAG: TonB-dependent receptor [Bacteroidota bacterium]
MKLTHYLSQIKWGLLLSLLMGMTSWLHAQKATLQGTVQDDEGILVGATIFVQETKQGVYTDEEGMYKLSLDPGSYAIEARYVGYNSLVQNVTVAAGETTTLNFNMDGGVMVDEVIVVGTRASNRTNMTSAVPVDVINLKKLTASTPQTSINQILHYTAPSFSSNTQTISDGTDHIDPASLRGLGPDQVLVLINGKRRHTTSLVNVNGTFGRGNVGTDLNAIPATAIDRIEVLRDGAAAQYGSDAIAGVINIVLREDVEKLNVNVTTGANFTNAIGPFEGELRNTDGELINVGANYGLPLGDKGGYINLTGEINYRAPTNRMLEFTGGIFTAFNAVERLAAADGLDVNALTLAQIQSYGSQVPYFGQGVKDELAALTSIEGVGGLLGFDATEDELSARGQTRSDYNMRVGQSQNRGGKMFANMSLPLGENAELYAFGGMSYRSGESGCFYRLPGQSRTMTSIYPNGTVPKINSNINDRSLGAGIKGMLGNWNTDFSIVTGSNSFLFYMTDTHNATLGTSSPTEFQAGGHSFSQTTSNLDFSQYFDNLSGITGINLAFGAEYRYENFKVLPGTEQSYGNYDINGNLVTTTTPDALLSRDLLGRNRPSGAQCFAGFLPTNEVDANRSSVAAYVDAEFDLSDAFLVGAALRFENYSDFGSTFNFKATARYIVSNNFVLRGAASSGFRAPSLHQIHFSRTSTIFTLVNGVSVPQEVGVFANTSRAARLLGIPSLQEETSNNFSLGFTAKVPDANLRLTVDAFQVNINDRIILTGQFGPSNEELQRIFDQAGATRAAFFANSIDTETRGLDVVISHSAALGDNASLRTDLAATFSQTRWDQDAGINSSEVLRNAGLVDTYFDQTSRIYLEQAVPRVKLTMGNSLELGRFSVYLRNTLFGQTTEATSANIFDQDLELIDTSVDPYNDAKLVTDLTLAYAFNPDLILTIGSNNLFDVFPDEVDPTFSSSGRVVYSRRSPQFSYAGRHLFARLIFGIK